MPICKTQLYSYRPATVMAIEGGDAFSFLQGQFTNELRQAPESVVYGLWLNQKGKVLADSHIMRWSGNRFVIFSPSSAAMIIKQRLEEYIVADDVALVDLTDKNHGLAIWGDEAGERVRDVWGALPVRGQFLAQNEGFVFAGRRVRGENYEIVGPENRIAEMRDKLRRLDCAEIGANEAEVARLEDGIPAIPQDIGPGDLPNEGKLEMAAISFAKGCYLGQEVMARLKNMGQVRRHLRVVQGRGPAPDSGAPLFQGGRKAGEIRSVASSGDGFIAMAMVTRLGFNDSAGFGLAVEGPDALTRYSNG